MAAIRVQDMREQGGFLAYEALLAAQVAACRREMEMEEKEKAGTAKFKREVERHPGDRSAKLVGLRPNIRVQDLAMALHQLVAKALPDTDLPLPHLPVPAPPADPPAAGRAQQPGAESVGEVQARSKALVLAYGHAVQQCRLLAVRKEQGVYELEAMVTFKHSNFLNQLLELSEPGVGQNERDCKPPRKPARKLALKQMAADGKEVTMLPYHPPDYEAHFGDHDLSARLSSLCIGNLVSESALPAACLTAGSAREVFEVVGGTQLTEGHGLLRQNAQPRVLSQWWCAPPPQPVAPPSTAASKPGAPMRPAARTPHKPMRPWEQVAADCSAVYVNPGKRQLQVTFHTGAWGGQCGNGKAPATGSLTTTSTSSPVHPLDSHSGQPLQNWVKLVIPFSLLRTSIAVRVLDVDEPSPWHPTCLPGPISRYQLVLSLAAPPEVYSLLPSGVRGVERQKLLDDMMRKMSVEEQEVAADLGGWGRMGGRPGMVQMDQWPPGSIRHNAQAFWARAGDFTGAGVTGHCLTYVLNIWQGPCADDTTRFLDQLKACGVVEDERCWGVCLPPLRTLACPPDTVSKVLHWMRLTRPPLAQEVGYALLCLTTSGLLPWELVTQEMLKNLAGHQAGVAETALYSCHTGRQPLVDEPLPVITRKLQALGSHRDHLAVAANKACSGEDTIEALHLADVLVALTSPSAGSHCCTTKRLHITPTRLVCRPPEMDLSNRVLREFSEFRDHFVRISFSDETGQQLFLTTLANTAAQEQQQQREQGGKGKHKGGKGKHKVYERPKIGEAWAQLMLDRWRHFLSRGFHLLGRHHQLLAFSSSQLRTACAWFMTPIYEHQLNAAQRAKWDLPPLQPLIEEGDQEGEEGAVDGAAAAGGGGQGLTSAAGSRVEACADAAPGQQQPEQVVFRDAPGVIYWLGSFDDCNKNPAKYAARIGQAFSSTVRAVQYIPGADLPLGQVEEEEVEQEEVEEKVEEEMEAAPPATDAGGGGGGGGTGQGLTHASSAHSSTLSCAVTCDSHITCVSQDSWCSAGNGVGSGQVDLRSCSVDAVAQLAVEPHDLSPAHQLTPHKQVQGQGLTAVHLHVTTSAAAAAAQPSAHPSPAASPAAAVSVAAPQPQPPAHQAAKGECSQGWAGEWVADDDDDAADHWQPCDASGVAPKHYFRAPQVPQRTYFGDYRLPVQEQAPEPEQMVDPNMIDDMVIIDWQDHDGRVKYTISDGVSPMGMQVARSIMDQIGLVGLKHPLAIQVRYAGCKGVFVPWTRDIVPPQAIRWRKSMKKFDSPHTDIEVVQVATFIPGYINRQIISLLLALGLDADRQGQIIQDKAEVMTRMLDDMLNNTANAAGMMRQLGYVDARTSRLLSLALASGMTTQEPFIHRMLNHMRSHALTMLRLKHRIFLEASAFLMGVIDEAGVLSENEIFVQVHRPGDDEPFIISKRWLLVTKNPCLHPGDIRVLRAVDKPALRHLVNVVVFPSRVSRPVTDMIAGSDLDGDQYWCCWDQSLIPLDDDDKPVQMAPGEYQHLPAVEFDKVEVDPHLIDQFLYFQVHDTLGMIANAHVAMADQHPSGARCGPCMKLAEKHAHAVDLAKTCRPVTLSQSLRPKAFPHFMENPNKQSYKSMTVLGRVYDWACSLPPLPTSAAAMVGPTQADPRLVLSHAPGFQVELAKALELCYAYNCDVLRLMAKYGCSSEVELMSGWLIRRAGEHVRKKEGLRQQILLEVGSLKGRYQQFFRALPLSVLGAPAQRLSGGRDVLQPDSYLRGAAQDTLLQGVLNGGQLPGGAGCDGGRSVVAGARASYQQHRTQQAAAGQEEGETEEESRQLLVRASAWYYAAYHAKHHPKAAEVELMGQAVGGAGGAGGQVREQRGFEGGSRGGRQKAGTVRTPPGVGGDAAGGGSGGGGSGGGSGSGGGGGGAAVPPWRGMRLLSFGWLHMERLLRGVNQLEAAAAGSST